MPVSTSTFTSANCTPLVPDPERPACHCASAAIGSVPSSLQASFHARPFDGLSLAWIRPLTATSVVGVDAERRRDFREQRIERLARRPVESPAMTDAAVVLPPDPPLNGYSVSPISAFTAVIGKSERLGRDHRHDRPRAGADVLRPAFHHHAAVRHDFAARLRAAAAAAPLMDRAPETGLDRARVRRRRSDGVCPSRTTSRRFAADRSSTSRSAHRPERS